MKQKKEKKKLSPFIAGCLTAGAACALYSIIFPFYRIGDYIIGILISVGLGWVVSTMAHGVDTSKQAPAQKPVPKSGDSAADALIQQGQDMLQAIRHENDLIPDPVLSGKMDELDDVANRIFHTVAEQPQKAPQIRKFMDYYLPTTLKMLTGFRKMDERKVTGENAAATRRQIEDAMDVVLKAFNRQLDTLYQDDMLDISTDIDVLENMLRRDGLVDTGFKAMGDQAGAQQKKPE